MLKRILAGWNRPRNHKRTTQRRPSLAFEQLEDRLVPAVQSILGVQTQTLASPTATSTSQVLLPGVWQNVVNQSVTTTASQTGVVSLEFEAQAFAGLSNRVGLRYLIDGSTDPNDAMVNFSGSTADTIDDIGTNSWQTLFLTRQFNLTPGAHVITVQMYLMNAVPFVNQATTVYTPVLHLTTYNVIDNQVAALSVEAAPIALGSGSPAQQVVTAGAWQTLVSQPITIATGMSGLVDLNFQTTTFSSLPNRVLVRYLVDGNPDPNDKAIAASPYAADAVEDMLNVSGNWRTLFLSRQLNLTPGAHTISVQVEFANQGVLGQDPVVYVPVLDLTGYRNIDRQVTGGGVQTQVAATPDFGTSAQQTVIAGAWTTVATLPLTIGTPRDTGLANMTFVAQASTDIGNRVYVRYLIDGRLDPNDQATNLSPSAADSTFDYRDQSGNLVWHTLSLTHLVSLTPGAHIVSVQVFVVNHGRTTGHDLTVVAPNLHMTGFANVTPSPYFNYDANTSTLTINGTSGNDTFKFTQATVSSATGVLTTTYTFTMNDSTVTYTSNQVTSVIVNGGGGSDKGIVVANDSYTASNGRARQTIEQIVMNAGSTALQKMDANNNPIPFLTMNGIATVNATMGQSDSATLYDSPGNDTLTTQGLWANMAGTGFSNTVAGAGKIYAYTVNGGLDKAYQYDGTGPSTFISSGVAYSLMQGTDHGQSFYNLAVGVTYNYGIARHKAQDIAIFYDSPMTDVFAGTTQYSYMYANDANGGFAMFNAAQGFGKVYAYSFVGGTDYYYNYDSAINFVLGFQRYQG